MIELRYRVIVNGNFSGEERVVQLPDAIDPRVAELRAENAELRLVNAELSRKLAQPRRRWWQRG